MLPCLPCWAFPWGYPLLNGNLPHRLLLPLPQQPVDPCPSPNSGITHLTWWGSLPHLRLLPRQSWRSHLIPSGGRKCLFTRPCQGVARRTLTGTPGSCGRLGRIISGQTWTGWHELEYANYALKTLPKGLKFFHPVSPLEFPKVMGLTNIHHPDALHCSNGMTHCLWCRKEGQNEGTIINHLGMTH